MQTEFKVGEKVVLLQSRYCDMKLVQAGTTVTIKELRSGGAAAIFKELPALTSTALIRSVEDFEQFGLSLPYTGAQFWMCCGACVLYFNDSTDITGDSLKVSEAWARGSGYGAMFGILTGKQAKKGRKVLVDGGWTETISFKGRTGAHLYHFQKVIKPLK